MKKHLVFVVLFITILSANAQTDLYMTNDFAQAYQNKTRSDDGLPGENYFTNYSDYVIEADFNPENGKIVGSETIIYHNESADTLDMMIIRLYQNIFQKGNPRDFRINSLDLTDGVKITKLVFDGIEININELNIYSSNLYLNLPKKINPKSTVKLSIDWELTMPNNTTVRNGKYGENIWFVGHWYPQISVYDDVFGWDNNTYTGVSEFYNDHSNFDVKITIPAPNLLWATGLQQNIEDVFTKKYSKRIQNAKKSDVVVKIITPEDYSNNKILKNSQTNTWHFTASKVPDFSFATSNQHNWDGVGILVPNQDKKVFISGVYLDVTENFHQLANFSRKIVSIFSFKTPAIIYPYPAMTVFQGGGGMEYPMMVNEEPTNSVCGDYYLSAHEIGHSYFPFFTGLNETRYAWMDEGLISFFTRLVTDELSSDCDHEQKIIDNYSRVAGNSNDLPLMMPSSLYKDFYAYRVIAYDRSAFALYQLYLYLGQDLFFDALQEFTKRWSYKHPYPYDFFFTFEDVVEENLSWFWNPYFFEFTKPNLSLIDVSFEGGLYFTVKNIGKMPLPIELTITLNDGRTQKVVEKIDCWKGENTCEFYIPINSKPKKLELGNITIPDIDKSDNIYEF